MQNNIAQNSNLIQTDITYIIRNFLSQLDRINFCMEINLFHSKKPGYDATYFFIEKAVKKNISHATFR